MRQGFQVCVCSCLQTLLRFLIMVYADRIGPGIACCRVCDDADVNQKVSDGARVAQGRLLHYFATDGASSEEQDWFPPPPTPPTSPPPFPALGRARICVHFSLHGSSE